MPRFEDIPIEPDEATNLPLHVRNCMRRHVALVRLITRTEIVGWLYRACILPAVFYIAWSIAKAQGGFLESLGLK